MVGFRYNVSFRQLGYPCNEIVLIINITYFCSKISFACVHVCLRAVWECMCVFAAVCMYA